MKNNIKFVFFTLILIAVLLLPNINSQTIKNDNLRNIKNPKDDIKPACFGLIYGQTRGVFEHASWPLSFVTLKFENRKTTSSFFGFYIIGFLIIGKTYFITADKNEYFLRTKEITLTFQEPIQRIDFYLIENDP